MSRTTRLRDLAKSRQYLRLLLASSLSDLGSEMGALAFPLVAILVLHSSAFAVGLLAMFSLLPNSLVSLPVGVWIDRRPGMRVLLIADIGRAAMLAPVPILAATNTLSIWQLDIIAFGVGTLTVSFEVAEQSLIPELVDDDQLSAANSWVQVSEQGSSVVGPGAAGVVVHALGAPAGVLVDALSYLWSAAWLRRIDLAPSTADDSAAAEDSSCPRWYEDVRAGLEFVGHQPQLRTLAATGLALALAARTAQITLLLYLVRAVHISATGVGIIFSIAGLGFLVGALSAEGVRNLLGPTTALRTAAAVIAATFIAFAVSPTTTAAVITPVALTVYGIAALVYNISSLTMRQQLSPTPLRGRINASVRFVSLAATPLAGLLAGGLITVSGYHTTLAACALIAALAVVILQISLEPASSRHGEPVQE